MANSFRIYCWCKNHNLSHWAAIRLMITQEVFFLQTIYQLPPPPPPPPPPDDPPEKPEDEEGAEVVILELIEL